MRWMNVLAISAGLAGCGGGGGGGGGGGDSLPLSMAFSPSTLEYEYLEQDLPGGMSVEVTVSGSTNVGTIYVAVADSGQTIDTSQLYIQVLDPAHYQVSFPTRAGLPPGTRTGTLTIRLCGTPNCSSLLGRDTLRYTLVVKPSPPPVLESLAPIGLSALIPAAAPTLTATMGGWVKDSTTLYAQVVDDGGTFDISGALQLSRAGNAFSAALPLAADLAEGAHSGTLTVSICSSPGCATPIGTQQLPYSVQLFSLLGGALGEEATVDGPIGTSRFYSPSDVVVDADHNVYVAATNNFALRKIDPSGNTTTVAPINGHAWGVALGPNGTVLVTDGFRCVIRSVAPDGTITNIAGNYDSCTDYSVNWPRGIVADPAGGGYFVQSSGNVVRKFAANGALSTFAGTVNQTGSTDGQGSAARFSSLNDVTRDSAGNLFVTDRNNYTVRKIAPDGTVTTFAGSAGQRAGVDGQGGAARFSGPDSITIDADDNLYVADVYDVSAIRKITPTGEVTTIARGILLPGGERLNIAWLGVSPDGEILAISDHSRDVIVRTRLKPPAD